MSSPTLDIRVVFRAALGANQFDDQVVALGDPFPEIHIVNLEDELGSHEFVISKRAPNFSNEMVRSIVEESKAQSEHFWNILAHVRKQPIRQSSEIQYEVEGQRRAYRKRSASLGAGAIGTAGPGWFAERASFFHRRYNYDLLVRMNFARSIADPVSRFVSLYAVLSAACGDRQDSIDEAILKVEPTILRTPSPKRRSTHESLFTRLRNELAHHRESVSVFDTHAEIETHVDRFEWVVGEILYPRIDPEANP